MSENKPKEKLKLSVFLDTYQLDATETDMVKMYARYVSEEVKLNRQIKTLKKYFKVVNIPVEYLEVA